MSLDKRLDDLKKLIQTPEFLEGKGLSNEVNIRIFCYEAKDEMIVSDFVHNLTNNKNLNCTIIECNLYKTFLSICEDMGIMDSISEMEEMDDGEYLLEQLHSAISEYDFINKIQYEPHKVGDVLLVTGVGDAFPFMRVHSLLEALQPSFSDIPILVMYPGEFNGFQLRLFNKLQPNDYYRAFNAIYKKEDK